MTAFHDTAPSLPQQEGMALFWETAPSSKPEPKAAPLSPLALALLLKLQSEVDK